LIALARVPVAQGGAGVGVGQALVLVDTLPGLGVALSGLAVGITTFIFGVLAAMIPGRTLPNVLDGFARDRAHPRAQGRTLFVGVAGDTTGNGQVRALPVLVVAVVVGARIVVVALVLEVTTSARRVAVSSTALVRRADILVRPTAVTPRLALPGVGDGIGITTTGLRSRLRALFMCIAGHATRDR